ncbi:MAG TPA: LCP family protein [Nocardioidaceae bacterium]|nr:LCP family protein [Nocardioidaceae bacterium]
MRTRLTRLRRAVALGAVLAATVVMVPDSGVRNPSAVLVKVQTGKGIDHPSDVIWVLAMGSDARPGESVVRSRADAIQLVGLNLRTGDGVIFGVPRDSWVSIPGSGSNRVNAALYFGGPELMAETVGGMFGIDIDYAFVAGFGGFERMVKSIGGVTVNSDMAFSDDNLEGRFKEGKNFVNGRLAVNFGRMRHFLPRGDFNRSAHQSELIKAIARKVDANEDKAGFIEQGVLAVVQELKTNLTPAELFRLAQAATTINPRKIKSCVLNGAGTTIGGASVILPDFGQAQRLGDATRRDAKLEGDC